jgi:hypothetical protein
MSDLFISYARQDRPRAEIFARTLEAHGWSVFWDPTIRAGSDWRDTIEKELQGARCVLVLWSKNSVGSRYVREEAEEAINRGALVPVLIDDIFPPFGFRSVQWADFSGWDGTEETPAFHRLISDIVALIGPPPKQVEEERRRQEAVEAERIKEEATRRAIEDARGGRGKRRKPNDGRMKKVEEPKAHA